MSRAGLVYVVGDVIRPGGFALEPRPADDCASGRVAGVGPSLNAAQTRTLLIREQPGGGRTVTTLNLKRIFARAGSDVPIGERDILCARLRGEKSLEPNHGIHCPVHCRGQRLRGLVYSQRF